MGLPRFRSVTKETRENKKKKPKKGWEKGPGERVRLQTAVSQSGRGYVHGVWAAVASHDATLRRRLLWHSTCRGNCVAFP